MSITAGFLVFGLTFSAGMPKMLPFRANFRDRLEIVTTNDTDKEHEDQCSRGGLGMERRSVVYR